MAVTDHISSSSQWAPLGLTPGRVVRAFGMRRSGNHAIADWILRNSASQSSLFLNNCAFGKSPMSSFQSIEINRQKCPAQTAKADLAGTCAPAGEGALLLISYEDKVPGDGKRGTEVSGPVPDTAIDVDLVIVRSFLNWSASLLRKLQGNAGYSTLGRAVVMLRAIEGYGRMLAVAETPGVVAICYDDWLALPDYRATKLARLGLDSLDNTIGPVSTYGGGSSFQKDVSDAGDLLTGGRSQQMANDPDYRDILRVASRDTALTDRLARIFPDDAQTLQALANGGAI